MNNSIIRHLQLNTSLFRSPKDIANYIISKNIDIAFLQEICVQKNLVSPLTTLLPKDFQYIEGIHFYYPKTDQRIACAIISKYPIIDYITIYYNTPDEQPKTIIDKDQFDGNLVSDTTNLNLPNSRGLQNSMKSRAILIALIQTPKGPIRLITTHFTVSDLCTETTQMYEMSNKIRSIIEHSKDIPTIFSGDLNIRAQSYSVMNIEKVITCHTKELLDTLGSTHIVKKKGIFPEGLAIDHVFSKGLKHIDTSLEEIDFSEHKALISKFEIR